MPRIATDLALTLALLASVPGMGASQGADDAVAIKWSPPAARHDVSARAVRTPNSPDRRTFPSLTRRNRTAGPLVSTRADTPPPRSRRPYVIVGTALGIAAGLGTYLLIADDSGDADFAAPINLPLAALAGAGIGALGGWIAGGIAGAP